MYPPGTERMAPTVLFPRQRNQTSGHQGACSTLTPEGSVEDEVEDNKDGTDEDGGQEDGEEELHQATAFKAWTAAAAIWSDTVP